MCVCALRWTGPIQGLGSTMTLTRINGWWSVINFLFVLLSNFLIFMIIRACYTKLTSSKLQFCSLYQLNWLFLSYMATEGNLTDSCTCCGSKSSQHCHLMEQHVNYIKGSRLYMRLTRRPYSLVQYFASFLFSDSNKILSFYTLSAKQNSKFI